MKKSATNKKNLPISLPVAVKQRHVYVVLPTYNEEQNIGALLERIDFTLQEEGLPYTVLIQNDGSTDQTLAKIDAYSERFPIRVNTHAINQGLGITIRNGLIEASKLCCAQDIIVTMDADNTHTPGLIARMVQGIREGNDMVIASRFQRGSYVRGVSLFRRLLSTGSSWLFRAIHPIGGVKDYTSGFRAYSGEVLREALDTYGADFVERDGFECMVEILLKIRRMDKIIYEVPLILRYDAKKGASKMRVFRTIVRTLKVGFQQRFVR